MVSVPSVLLVVQANFNAHQFCLQLLCSKYSSRNRILGDVSSSDSVSVSSTLLSLLWKLIEYIWLVSVAAFEPYSQFYLCYFLGHMQLLSLLKKVHWREYLLLVHDKFEHYVVLPIFYLCHISLFSTDTPGVGILPTHLQHQLMSSLVASSSGSCTVIV